jgi:hypothetical protein
MLKYLLVLCILCIGCGQANVKNTGPKADESVQKKEEKPTTTWTIVIEDRQKEGKKK